MYGLVKIASKKLYHLSEQNLDGKVLEPRIPDNYLTKNDYEEKTTSRVSFARSINGALVGLSSNLKGKEFFVYEPADYSNISRKSISSKEVPDAELTEEEWVTSPVTLKKVGRIRVGEAHEQPLVYRYGEHEGNTYRWNYEHIY